MTHMNRLDWRVKDAILLAFVVPKWSDKNTDQLSETEDGESL